MKKILTEGSHASFVRASLTSMAVVFVLSSTAILFSFPSSADAAPKKGFEASAVSVPTTQLSIEPGKTQQVNLSFKNTGTTTWKQSGSAHVSVYTQGPKYRASDFRADTWVDYTQAVVLKESTVAPGSTGTFVLTLKAPLSKGTYKETFQLAAEDTAWIPGGEFTLQIVVAPPVPKEEVKKPEAAVTPVSATPAPVRTDLAATILLRSAKSITAKAGQEVSYRIGVKNAGTTAWNKREIRTSDITIAAVGTRHTSWVSDTQLAVKSDVVVSPGGLDFIDFKFSAPKTNGHHVLRYRMAVNDTVIPDFFIEIPVDVTGGSGEALEAPLTQPSTTPTTPAEEEHLIPEPIIRIGVLIVDEEVENQVDISCNTPWKLRDGENGLLAELGKDEKVKAFYKNKRYYFNRGKGLEQTYQYLRFVPDEKDAVCTILNFDKSKTRNAAFPENQYRDTLELRYNEYKDRAWIINELPIDEYLYGLGETSNASHEEFKKVLVTSARTYALYNYERATKHAKEFFHMNAYADDQVYRGYGYEIRNPLIKQAVIDTAGMVVQYQGATALTPYFSRSDGRTRDWSEVWGGSVPWAKSVPAPCDAKYGRKLWGHGVGMSATEALCMAKEGGKTWQEILHYFYFDVDIAKRWQS